MPSVYVLNIDDAVVGPHLHLLRRVCRPESRGVPHITVRYFERLAVPEAYEGVRVSHIDLIAPGEYATPGGRVIYVASECDELLPLEHKPHFPTSEFHVTLYEGRSIAIANGLLAALSTVKWNFRVALPDSKLTRVQIRTGGRERIPKSESAFSTPIASLFHELTGRELEGTVLRSLTVRDRLALIADLCDHLGQMTRRFRRIRRKRTVPASPDSGSDASPEVHLTPPELARDIAAFATRFLEPTERIDFGDPAVGTGAFYAGLVHTVGTDRIASAVGIDISAEQVGAARARWARRGMKVTKGDYLHMDELPKRNLILANPPYLRHQAIPPEYKEELRVRASVDIGVPVNARAGLYVYFMLLSHKWMEEGGVAAWLVPSEFMQAVYGGALRFYLTRCVQLLAIHQFDHTAPQFENAKVLPCVVVFRRCRPVAEADVIVSVGPSMLAPLETYRLTIGQLRRLERWAIPPRLEDAEEEQSVRLGDLFVIRRGIATGANDFFVMERSIARERGIPASAVKPILPKVRALESDIVERAADGYPKVAPQVVMIDCELTEREIRDRYPAFWRYLAKGRESGILEGNLVRSRRPWYRQERRPPPPFLCTYMGRGSHGGAPLRFIWNRSEATATNTYILLYPRPDVATLLKKPGRERELFDLLRRVAGTTISERWRTHADGLRKIEPGELAEVRVLDCPEWLKPAAMNEVDLGLNPRAVRR